MMDINKDIIKEQFQGKAVVHSNIWMYFTQVAVEVIQQCRELNIAIHGLDAFRIRSNGIQPSQTHSLRFNDRNNGNWEEAIAFIKSKEDTEFVFEIWYKGY